MGRRTTEACASARRSVHSHDDACDVVTYVVGGDCVRASTTRQNTQGTRRDELGGDNGTRKLQQSSTKIRVVTEAALSTAPCHPPPAVPS
jgi:hypothetical protein